MALTITRLGIDYVGQKRRTFGTFAFDTSYPATGYPITPRQLECSSVEELNIASRQGYVFSHATSPSYTGSHVVVLWGDWTAATDGALVEVTAGTNLSTLTSVPWEAIGI